MQPTFVVLTDLSRSAEAALTYTTRLAQRLDGRLVLLHVFLDPVLEPEISMVAAPILVASREEIITSMVQQASTLPVPADTEVVVDVLSSALANVVQQHHPLLLALGREEPDNLLDRLVGNRALPILQDTRHPLLLVPEGWQDTELPQRLVVAIDAHPFWLSAPSLALDELFDALQPTTTVVHVIPGQGPSQTKVELASVQRTGLFGKLTSASLYEVWKEAPAAGILHAAAELKAQLIVMLARPHTFLGGLFHRSITAQILRRSPIPVLVLPTTK
ncbi:UspA domain protein [Hymenobacter roseosalivarius DSM 11622]|uniref:UspA domain protein n=1 Tax=Hymenobacter roseosalivarius DSM 11622 TaxID=645990 RepID=A0A1W1W1D9_9BACT|nr:universal stress protein [Hymenobacter roseosalivarius]SMB98914.1 UspA domain protein [Hymenobacter roseosalivarius DSM 11622]